MSYRGVIFDLGGVVLDSPLHAIARYEEEVGIPAGFINRHVVSQGPSGAWQRLERGELDMEAFCDAFDAETSAAGVRMSTRDMMQHIRASSAPRPAMLAAIAALRRADYRVAALTNNWSSEDSRAEELRSHFDLFVESSVVGLRKPDPRIYRLTCEGLRLEPHEAVFLDDIGSNLKAARALGMHTIKVVEAESALTELGEVLELDLG